jgi:hypothetical protein
MKSWSCLVWITKCLSQIHLPPNNGTEVCPVTVAEVIEDLHVPLTLSQTLLDVTLAAQWLEVTAAKAARLETATSPREEAVLLENRAASIDPTVPSRFLDQSGAQIHAEPNQMIRLHWTAF